MGGVGVATDVWHDCICCVEALDTQEREHEEDNKQDAEESDLLLQSYYANICQPPQERVLWATAKLQTLTKELA